MVLSVTRGHYRTIGGLAESGLSQRFAKPSSVKAPQVRILYPPPIKLKGMKMSEFEEIEYPHNKPVKVGTYRLTFEILEEWDLYSILQVIEGELGGAIDKVERMKKCEKSEDREI